MENMKINKIIKNAQTYSQYQEKKINKEKLINKFIEKFPKVKLETIIQINKYYNNIEINEIQIDTKKYLYCLQK